MNLIELLLVLVTSPIFWGSFIGSLLGLIIISTFRNRD
jgi:hypothetical protein